MSQKTFLPEKSFVQSKRQWHHLNAEGQVLGRLASRIASLLHGKHKVYYTPHLDCGDFVVVTNAGKVRLTGDKLNQKTYFSHSGYADGAKVLPIRRLLEKRPVQVLTLAVKRMLPKNRLGARQIVRLKAFPGPEHSFKGKTHD